MENNSGMGGAVPMEYRYYRDASGLVHDADCYCVKDRVNKGTGLEDFKETDTLHTVCARRCMIKKGMWSDPSGFDKYESWFNECRVTTGLLKLLVLERCGHFRLHSKKMLFFVGTDAWEIVQSDSDSTMGYLYHRDYRINHGKVRNLRSYHLHMDEHGNAERDIKELIRWICCHSVRVPVKDRRKNYSNRKNKNGGRKK